MILGVDRFRIPDLKFLAFNLDLRLEDLGLEGVGIWGFGFRLEVLQGMSSGCMKGCLSLDGVELYYLFWKTKSFEILFFFYVFWKGINDFYDALNYTLGGINMQIHHLWIWTKYVQLYTRTRALLITTSTFESAFYPSAKFTFFRLYYIHLSFLIVHNCLLKLMSLYNAPCYTSVWLFSAVASNICLMRSNYILHNRV